MVEVNLGLFLLLHYDDFFDDLLFGCVLQRRRRFAIGNLLLNDFDLVSLYDQWFLFGVSLEGSVGHFLFEFGFLVF